MNRKHNPWVALAALILLVTILVMTCAGCNTAAAVETVPRFTCKPAGEADGVNLYIITDTETGVHYLMAEKYGHGYGIGLTKMEE